MQIILRMQNEAANSNVRPFSRGITAAICPIQITSLGPTLSFLKTQGLVTSLVGTLAPGTVALIESVIEVENHHGDIVVLGSMCGERKDRLLQAMQDILTGGLRIRLQQGDQAFLAEFFSRAI